MKFWQRSPAAQAAEGGSDTLLPGPDAAHPIGRLGLFLRAEDEADYVQANWAQIAGRLRLLGLVGGGAFFMASVVDWLHLHGQAPFLGLLALRLGVLALGLHLWRTARAVGVHSPVALRYALILFELGVIVAFRLVNVGYGNYSPNQGLSALLMTLAFYAFVPMLAPANFWLLPLATLTLLVQSLWWFEVPMKELATLLVMATFVHILGWAAAAQNARGRRLAWLDSRRLAREMKERRAAESNLQHLFEVCPVPLVLSAQDDGLVLRFNQAAQNLLDPAGRFSEPGTAWAGEFYVDAQVRQQVGEALRARGQVGPMDARLRSAEGDPIHVMLAARSLHFDGQDAVLTSLVEITERKRRELRLARLVQTDALTGLYNRTGFFERSQALLAKADRADCSVLLMDADHFKRVNDTYGHAVGDVVLQQIASRMSTVLRDGDVLGRIGGEEFAVFLPNTPKRAARLLAERIRQIVDRHALRVQGQRVPMSLSIGVALVLPTERTVDAALSRADAAMYRAKQSGRNRVEVSA